MKLILKIILIIVILAYPVLVTGQKEYQKGYIVTNSNDTLYGKIRDRKLPPFGTIYKKIRLRGLFSSMFKVFNTGSYPIRTTFSVYVPGLRFSMKK